MRFPRASKDPLAKAAGRAAGFVILVFYFLLLLLRPFELPAGRGHPRRSGRDLPLPWNARVPTNRQDCFWGPGWDGEHPDAVPVGRRYFQRLPELLRDGFRDRPDCVATLRALRLADHQGLLRLVASLLYNVWGYKPVM